MRAGIAKVLSISIMPNVCSATHNMLIENENSFSTEGVNLFRRGMVLAKNPIIHMGMESR